MGDKSACMGCGAHPADYCYRCFDKMVDQRDKNAAVLNRVGQERDEARAECERLREAAQALFDVVYGHLKVPGIDSDGRIFHAARAVRSAIESLDAAK